jgi:hypothetical protein
VDVSIVDFTGDKKVEDLATKISSAFATKPTSHCSFVQLKGVQEPRLILVCFPHLGGSTSLFTRHENTERAREKERKRERERERE